MTGDKEYNPRSISKEPFILIYKELVKLIDDKKIIVEEENNYINFQSLKDFCKKHLMDYFKESEGEFAEEEIELSEEYF